MSAVGFLGVSLIVLHILGYTSFLLAALGAVLLAASTYSVYRFYYDVSVIAVGITYQNLIMAEDEYNEED
jgi:hypothetical protein